MKKLIFICIILFTAVAPFRIFSQNCCEQERSSSYPPLFTSFDTVLASRIEILHLPESYRLKTLPPVIDNSTLPYFPGVCAQHMFFSCQQYSGITFTFAYEMNRLRNVPGTVPENRYPAHYTWNFLNYGGQYIGVNFLHSFHALMQQGHMAATEYGADTAFRFLGWPTGYEKYEKAFPNRIRKIWAIPTTTEEGILTLKHYLNDHLEGSWTGGIACFTAAGPTNIMQLPNGTPEGGKYVQTEWLPWATHGMTIVGYNDSIRYDLNEDGQYTNHIDINGDGFVDVKDWEIGGFKYANSYGTWWGNEGYAYALYHSFACEFEEGGVWNNSFFIVEPDPGYEALLGMEFTLKYNQRDKIRFLAGVNTDTSAAFPSHTMEFPFFRFQGGPHVMQGIDSIPGQDEIELGLDVTPLLSYIEPGEPARFFFILEEKDPYNTGAGMISSLAFHDYSGSPGIFTSPDTDVPVVDNGITYLSAISTVDFEPLEITTSMLPSSEPGVPYSAQLDAAGGKEPYRWSLIEEYRESATEPGYQGVNEVRLWEHSAGLPFAQAVLPFSFPFFGKTYDTVYVNYMGMIHFTSDHLPYPYLIDWYDLLRNIPAIFPAFCWNYENVLSEDDGMWMKAEAGKVTFRWKMSVNYHENTTDNRFELVLYPDGSFEFHYGDCINLNYNLKVVAGYSKGDDVNVKITDFPGLSLLSNTSCRYSVPLRPAGISVSESGLLTVDNPDTSFIYDIKVKATDARLLTDTREFQFSAGLIVRPVPEDSSGMVQYGQAALLDLAVTNTGQAVLEGLQFSITSSDTSVVLADSSETMATLSPGGQVNLDKAFSFYLKDPMSDGSLLYFDLSVNTASHQWQYPFHLFVAAPDIRMTRSFIHDGANNLLDPGEVADLEVDFGNFGSLAADSLDISAITADTSLTILSLQGADYESLQPNGSITRKIRLRASRHVTPGSVKQLTVNLTAASGFEKQFEISLQLGSKPVAIVSLVSTTSSVYAMKTALDSIGAGYDVYSFVDNVQLGYSAIFLILGTTTGTHLLTEDEGAFFANYLQNGGNLYVESYAEWYYNDLVQLHPLMHFTTVKVPAYDFEEMAGSPGTFCEGLDFLYMGTSNQAIFNFLPVPPGFAILRDTDSPPHALQIAYGEDDYKSIGSMVEFGKLADNAYPSTKTELMRRYLEFFNVLYNGPYPYFHADSTTICRYHPVTFIDDSWDNTQSWHWEFQGGNPSSSDLQQPTVIYPAEGVYDVSLTVSDGITTHSLTRKAFIRVEVCAGLEEPSVLSGVIVYPNPAQDMVTILVPSGVNFPAEAVLIDLTGRRLLRVTLPLTVNGGVSGFSTKGFPDGLYMLQITGAGESAVKKIIIRH